jgi:diketogulonate reductase-like aldo/keto reductase
MKTITLNNGVKMPILGFGVFQITDLEVCESSIIEAINCGYRLVDTASSYHNEIAVGKAIKKCDVPREELFITTKLWVEDVSYEKAKKAFYKSLEKLQLEYLDMYLIHQPYNDIFGAWRAMEELYEEGLIKAIGVCNFSPDRLVDLSINSKIKPAINQIETHPMCQQIEPHKILKEENIQHQSWGPFAEGKDGIFENELLKNIGKKYNKSIAQVILRWLIQRDIVVIPKSVSKQRIIENIDVFDFELTDDDMSKIVTLDKNQSSFFNHNDVAMVKWLCEKKLED